MTLSETLRKLMREQRITIDALAKGTGIPPSTIKTWISGTTPRNLEHVRRVAQFLGVTFEYLCFGEDASNANALQSQLLEEVFEGWLKVKIERVIKTKSDKKLR